MKHLLMPYNVDMLLINMSENHNFRAKLTEISHRRIWKSCSNGLAPILVRERRRHTHTQYYLRQVFTFYIL